MARKKNRYYKKSRKKGFLNGITGQLHAKGNVKHTALETGKDLIIGVVGGGLLGAAFGRTSLVVGLITTGMGHYTGSKLAQSVGIGMMASNGFQRSGAVSGLEGLDGIKERLQAYKDSFSEKLFLDKILKRKGVGGFGDVQYFTYPSGEMNGELAALDNIENQIAESAMQFQGQLPSDEFGMVQMEERLY